MATDLDRMLEPGERVVYRTRRYFRFVRPDRFSAADVLAIMGYAALLLGIWLFASKKTVENFISLLLLAVAVFSLQWLLSRFMLGQVWLTDRRVIGKSGGREPTMTAIPLDQVEMLLRLPGGRHEIRGKDGRTIDADSWELPDHIFGVVARATGLAPPDLPGLKDKLAVAVIVLAAFAPAVLLPFLSSDVSAESSMPWVESLGALEALGILLLFAILFVLTGTVFVVISFAFGFTIGVASARCFMTAEEIRRWLCRDIEVGRWWIRTLIALMLRFASLLYGQPIRCKSCAEAHHGR
jgi:hypothetical protein